MNAATRLTPDLQSAASARRFTRDALIDRVEGDLLEDVLLVVSELVTNAVLHGFPPIDLVLDVPDASPDDPFVTEVTVSVSDGASAQPRQGRPTVDSPDGRGLQIVDALSTWGCRPRPSGQGKEIWALVSR